MSRNGIKPVGAESYSLHEVSLTDIPPGLDKPVDSGFYIKDEGPRLYRPGVIFAGIVGASLAGVAVIARNMNLIKGNK